jgi:hypothetical protein
VAGANDVNGDGSADVVVGARFYDAGQTTEGTAFVFLPEPDSRLALVAGLALLALLDRHRRHREPARGGPGRRAV